MSEEVQQALAVIPDEQAIIQRVKEQYAALPKPHLTYIIVYERKQRLLKLLELKELEAQTILLHPGDTITEIEASLAKYRAMSTAMSDIRKPFTNELYEKIDKPLMLPEQRVDYTKNEKYKEVSALLLQKKKDAKAKEDEVNAKTRYINLYRAHIQNQNTIIVAEYKKQVINEIAKMYKFFLENKEENPDLKTLKQAVLSIELPKRVVFDRDKDLINKEEAIKIIAQFTMPDFSALQKESVLSVDKAFELYKQDLAQVRLKPEIAEEISSHFEQEVQEIQSNTEIQVGTTTIIAEGSAMPIIKSEGKAIKRAWKIVPENSDQWLVNIITTFAGSAAIRSYSKAKDVSKITVQQMADYIGKYATDKEVKFQNLEYILDEK